MFFFPPKRRGVYCPFIFSFLFRFPLCIISRRTVAPIRTLGFNGPDPIVRILQFFNIISFLLFVCLAFLVTWRCFFIFWLAIADNFVRVLKPCPSFPCPIDLFCLLFCHDMRCPLQAPWHAAFSSFQHVCLYAKHKKRYEEPLPLHEYDNTSLSARIEILQVLLHERILEHTVIPSICLVLALALENRLWRVSEPNGCSSEVLRYPDGIPGHG